MGRDFDSELDTEYLSRMKWEAEIEKKGDKNLLCFGTADMDYATAKPIREALNSVIKSSHFGYPYIKDSYYKSIIKWFDRKTGWRFNKDAIATNVGIYTSAWTVIDSISNPRDEIIFQPPVHFCFKELIENNGRKPIENPLVITDGEYTMNLDSLQEKVSERTKAFWLCNPHNPVGRAWRKEELENIAEFCLKNDLKIMTDDVYCGLTYEEGSYIPIASLSKEISNITITLVSPSKTYNVTGIKHSYIICENQSMMQGYIESLKKLDLTYGMNIMGLAATEAAYNYCDLWTRNLMDYIKENYLFLKCSSRINIACTKKILIKGAERMKKAYDEK